MSGRQSGSLKAQQCELPWDLWGLELGKDPATLSQVCIWLWMGCTGCEWISKPNHQENMLVHSDASHSTLSIWIVPWTESSQVNLPTHWPYEKKIMKKYQQGCQE